MRKILYLIFRISGIIFVLITILFAIFTISAVIDRINYGPGIMFASVEILLTVTIFFLLLSVVLLFSANRLKKSLTSTK